MAWHSGFVNKVINAAMNTRVFVLEDVELVPCVAARRLKLDWTDPIWMQ
jgi:hypothetical protein